MQTKITIDNGSDPMLRRKRADDNGHRDSAPLAKSNPVSFYTRLCLATTKPWKIAVVICAIFVVVPLLYYAIFWAVTHGWLDQDVKDKCMIVYSMRDTLFTLRQGMFSDMAAVIGALHYAETHGAAAIYFHYDNDWYVDPARGPNYLGYFFDPYIVLKPEIANPPEVHFNRILARYGHYGSFSQVLSGHPDKDSPYPISYEIPLSRANELVRKYLKVKESFWKQVETWHKQHFDPATFQISVHFRGTDKKVVNYPYVSPAYDIFDFYIKKVVQKYKPAKWKVFVATDETEFIDWIEKKYPGKVAYYNAPRLSSKDAVAAQGGVHKSAHFPPYVKAESGMVDMLLLAFGNYLIKNRSSLSDSALAFHPMNYVFILGPSIPIYSSDNLGQPPAAVLQGIWSAADAADSVITDDALSGGKS